MIACTAIAAALLTGSVTTGPITCPDRIVIRDVQSRTSGAHVLDATGATFVEGVTVANAHGLTIKAGTYGTEARDTKERSAVQIINSADVSMAGPTVLGAPPILGETGALLQGDRNGIQARGSTRVTIRNGSFKRFRTGLSFYEVTDSIAHQNNFREGVSDGINIVGSHRVVASQNDCRWLVRVGKNHPDCIQLWSIKDKPLQTDIWVVNNNAEGNMQAYLSSDPKTGSGVRLHFYGNRAWVIFAHTVTCGLCRDSVAKFNVLSSHPGTLFGIGRLKGFEPERGNIASDNPMIDGTKTPPARLWWSGVIPFEYGSRFDQVAIMPTVQP